MKKFLALCATLMPIISCSGAAQAPDQQRSVPARRVAFVSQCLFENGARIILIHRFGTDAYHFVIRNGEANDLTTIRPINDQDLDIETNGGIGKMVGVGTLFRWLLGGTFRAVGADEFEDEMARGDVPRCPGDYPFSP